MNLQSRRVAAPLLTALLLFCANASFAQSAGTRTRAGRRAGTRLARRVRAPGVKPTPPSPAALARQREQIYKLIFDGKYQHDGAGELLYIGDMTSVPALLRVLKDNPPRVLADGRRSYVCTYSHAVAALMKITGHKAVTLEEWAAWWDEY